MGRVAMLTGSRGLRYATVIALVAALVGGVYVLSSTGNKRTIVGYFTSAVGALATPGCGSCCTRRSSRPMAPVRNWPG